MYCVYRILAAAAYLSLYFFIFLSLQFSNIKHFHCTFLRNCEAYKVPTMGGCIMFTSIRLLLLINLSLYLFFFPIFNIKFFHHTFLRNCEAYKVETCYTWTVGGCIVFTRIRVLLLKYSSLISLFSFLSNFQTLNFFVTLFSETVRATKLKLSTHMGSWWMYCVYRI